jgi:three-Cys-motif partner protein
MENNFFETQSPSSRTKAQIVAKYFPQYCKIILKRPQKEIRYLDLFAGPGLYDDGNLSTPLLLADYCAKDAALSEKVRFLFNDKEYCGQLERNFNERYPKGTFKLTAKFGHEIVGESEAIRSYLSKKLSGRNQTPTLLFFDPWGYKGIDTLMLAQFLTNWGNELFLFVNVKRIHAATENEKFDLLMQLLFPTTIDKVRKDRKYKAKVHERIKLIMDNLTEEFKKAVSTKLYSCAFRFQEEDSNTTSHFIVHFTKHDRGYELVKNVYQAYDNIGAILENDNVYTFDAKQLNGPTNSIFDFGQLNIVNLSRQIFQEYRGRRLSAKSLYDEHQVKTLYTHTHYAKALRHLQKCGALKSTFNDNIDHTVSVLINENCNLEFLNVEIIN